MKVILTLELTNRRVQDADLLVTYIKIALANSNTHTLTEDARGRRGHNDNPLSVAETLGLRHREYDRKHVKFIHDGQA
jgi:hypothetical protein